MVILKTNNTQNGQIIDKCLYLDGKRTKDKYPYKESRLIREKKDERLGEF